VERAGGLARARSAWRHFDGTFMPESAKIEAQIAEYDRYVAGRRARAARAARSRDGTFLPCLIFLTSSFSSYSLRKRSNVSIRNLRSAACLSLIAGA
jgi:hypothetical protein